MALNCYICKCKLRLCVCVCVLCVCVCVCVSVWIDAQTLQWCKSRCYELMYVHVIKRDNIDQMTTKVVSLPHFCCL